MDRLLALYSLTPRSTMGPKPRAGAMVLHAMASRLFERKGTPVIGECRVEGYFKVFPGKERWIGLARRVVPVRVRQALRDARRRAILRSAIGRMRALSDDRWPDTYLLEKAWTGWGNTGWSASPEFLDRMVRLAGKTRGPILECGSGLTTLLLGIVAARHGLEVWSLEHDANWHETARVALAEHRIDAVNLDLATLRDYGAFEWYDPPIARMPSEFSLVICDGPPESTRGGRYGLLPVMHPHLARGCVILLDDVEREGERDILTRWSGLGGVQVDPDEPECSYALVRLTD